MRAFFCEKGMSTMYVLTLHKNEGYISVIKIIIKFNENPFSYPWMGDQFYYMNPFEKGKNIAR